MPESVVGRSGPARLVRLMGIVNVTPDSFSDGGRFLSPAAAVEHGLKLVEQGAELLDVGGESTRPGATPVPWMEELKRVLPVVEGLRRAAPQVPISIDTSKPEVARAALEAGASVVNDVTALGDERMGPVVAEAGAGVCVMHMQGTPQTMQHKPWYGDVVAEVTQSLALAVNRAVAAGIARDKVWVDPGIGFGKSMEHNLELLRGLAALRSLGCPILIGTSRKGFIGALLGKVPPERRVLGSAVSIAVLASRGLIDVARVHDVSETREALAIALAL